MGTWHTESGSHGILEAVRIGLEGGLTLGWAMEEEMAASMTAIFSRFSAPLMFAGSTMLFTATTCSAHASSVVRRLLSVAMTGCMQAWRRCFYWSVWGSKYHCMQGWSCNTESNPVLTVPRHRPLYTCKPMKG